MKNSIEFKFNQDVSVFFKPLENGKSEYLAEVHDFSNLDCFKYGIVSYHELQSILNNPLEYTKFFR